MLRFFSVASVLLASVIGLSSASGQTSSTKQERANELQSLKVAFQNESIEARRFVLLNKLVEHYARDPITPDMKAEVEASAASLLTMSEKYQTNWNYGNAIHHANIALGRLSLLNGDFELAIKHLKRASETPGSPQLNAFGPNMTLAKDLLAHGERAAVLEYIDACDAFWDDQFSAAPIAKWKAEIAEGKTPNFDPQVY